MFRSILSPQVFCFVWLSGVHFGQQNAQGFGSSWMVRTAYCLGRDGGRLGAADAGVNRSFSV